MPMEYYYSSAASHDDWYAAGRRLDYHGQIVRVIAPLEHPNSPGKIIGVFVRWTGHRTPSGRYRDKYAHLSLDQVKPAP